MESIKPNINFKIQNTPSSSADELQSLTLLYQPIIGVDAFSLYLTILNLPKNTPLQHHLILQLLDKDMKRLIETRNILEAIGLLDVYVDKDIITYILKQPLSSQKFFGDAIMSACLYIKIGAHDFNTLKKITTKEQTALTGKKTTKKFDEIFDIRPLTRIEKKTHFDDATYELTQGIELATSLDFSTIATVLIKKGISQSILTPELTKILNEFAFLYKFDTHELAHLVFDATLPDQTVDYPKMKTMAKTQFQLINKGEKLKIVTKNDQQNQPNTQPSETADIISFLEQSPIEFLRFKSSGKPPVPADIKLVEWLFIDQNMPAGVVNVLVDYVLNHTDGSLPKQMVEKIAGQWQRQKIDTTQAAMNKVATAIRKSNAYKKEKQQPFSANKKPTIHATRSEPIPKWLDNVHDSEDVAVETVAAKKRIEEMKQAMIKKGASDD